MIGTWSLGERWLGSGRVTQKDYTEIGARLEVGTDLESGAIRGRQAAGSMTATADLSGKSARNRGVSGQMRAGAWVGGQPGRRMTMAAQLRALAEAGLIPHRSREVSGRLSGGAEVTGRSSRARSAQARLQANVRMESDVPRGRVVRSRLTASAGLHGLPAMGRAVNARLGASALLRGDARAAFYASPESRRLIVPPKIRSLPVNPKGRIVEFAGDDDQLALQLRSIGPRDRVDIEFRLDRWFRTFPNDEIRSVELDASDWIDGPVELLSDYRFRVWVKKPPSGGPDTNEGFRLTALVTTGRGRVERVDVDVQMEVPAMDEKVKQPREVVDYMPDMTRWFREVHGSDEIVGVSVSIDIQGHPDDLVSGPGTLPTWSGIGDPVHSAKLWFGGGRDGVTYQVNALITTASGRVEDFPFLVRVEQQ